MKLSKELVEAIETYVISTLKDPTGPGAKVELVPELVRALNEISYSRHQCLPNDPS